jgi:putative ABC transport system ATP-binding protein
MTIGLQCQGLAGGWAKRRLIENVDLDIDFSSLNQCLPIVGRTGLGKSTLLYVISGMALPMSGRVAWRLPSCGQPASSEWQTIAWSGETRRTFADAAQPRPQSFGFLLQDAAMIPCFTVKENLLHGMRLRGVRGSREQMLKRIRTAVAAMSIEGEDVDRLLEVHPGRLSGGQRQRMALAAATVHDPAVLFADEPTASLDDETGLQILKAIRRWLDGADPAKRAFVFVTHRLEIIRDGVGAPRMLRLTNGAHHRQGPLHFEWQETSSDKPDRQT